VKIFQLKLHLIIALIVLSCASNAQQLVNQLFIHNIKNNSYQKVIAFQPYAVFTDNNEILKGYFDAVYDESFLFATKDSVFVLKTENIKGVVETAGISGNPNNYSKGGSTALQAGGITMVTLGALFLPATIVALTEEISAGVILTVFTGGLIGGGIAMLNTVSKRKNNIQSTVSLEEMLRNSKNQLRIIKSPL
jgi:hypothetical protein